MLYFSQVDLHLAKSGRKELVMLLSKILKGTGKFLYVTWWIWIILGSFLLMHLIGINP